jgi:hypothetical protein
MPLPRLQDVDAMLDRVCMDVLGDTISYRPEGENGYIVVQVYGDFTDKTRSIEGTDVVEQAISLQVLKTDVPAKPSSGVRIRIPELGARLFRPHGTGSDESGAHWVFLLKEVQDIA